MGRTVKQYLRYEAAGMLVFFLNCGLLYVLTEFGGLYYLLSGAIAFLVSVQVSYVLSVHFVFQKRSREGWRRELVLFLLMNLFRLGVNQLILWFCTSRLGLYYMVSQCVSALFSKVYNFVTQKLLLDRKKDKGQGE